MTGNIELSKALRLVLHKTLSNHCILNWYDFGTSSLADEALSLFIGLADSMPFASLRTQNQLGYIVKLATPSQFHKLAAFVLVQGSYKTPDEMNEYINEFWATFQINEEELAILKESMATSYQAPDLSLGALNERLWNEIVSGRYEFDI